MCYDVCEARGQRYADSLTRSPDDRRDPGPCALPVTPRDPLTLELFPALRIAPDPVDYFLARYPGLLRDSL